MARKHYFTHCHTLIPPRGGGFEWTELRPIRPNQDVLLPGVVIRGTGLDFQTKNRDRYRSRHGFSQTDGIAQYSGKFYPFQDHLRFKDTQFAPDHLELPKDFLTPYCASHDLRTLSEHSFASSRPSLSSQSWRRDLNPRPRRRHVSAGQPELAKKMTFGGTFEAGAIEKDRPRSDQRFDRLRKRGRKWESCSCLSSLPSIGGEGGLHHNEDLRLMFPPKSSSRSRYPSGQEFSSISLLSKDILSNEAQLRPTSRESLQHAYSQLYRNQLPDALQSDILMDQQHICAKWSDVDSEAGKISEMGEDLVKDSIDEVSKMLMKQATLDHTTKEKHVSFNQAPNIAVSAHE